MGASGAICPLGRSLEDIYRAMAAGKSGISKHENAFDLGKDEYLGIIPDSLLESAESSKLRNMICQAVNQTIEGLHKPEILSSADTRVIFCSTKGEIDQIEGDDFENAQLFSIANFLQEKYKLSHKPTIISTACISGLMGIINAARLVESGMAKNVLVIGADLVTKFTLSGFISFYATATSVSKPYDKYRDGINLGEAAASILVTSDKSIFKKPLGTYLGGASANDANHISGPSRTGEGLVRSVANAMTKASVVADDIHYISAHGTATKFNDEMEAIAFDRLQLNQVPLNSFKAYLGHTLGAAGLIETLIGLASLNEGTLLASKGFETAGVSKRVKVLAENLDGNFNTMLKTSSGFGGSNAAAIFKKQG